MLWSGCSGKSPVAPTPDLAIVCPASISARAAVGAVNAPVSYAAATTTGGKAPVTTSCSQTSGFAFPVGSTTVSCNASDAAGHIASCAFSVTVDPAPIPQLAYTKYLGFGDSETEGKVSRVPQLLMPNSYTLKLQSMLQARYTNQTIVVADDGQGGEMASDPQTVVRFDAALLRETPQVVLIMDGANDLLNLDVSGIVPAISAVGTLGAHATDRGVQIFLATLPPSDPSKRLGGGASAVGPFNAQLASLAASRNWTLVDVNAAFHGDLGLLGSDGLHPTDAGYQVIAQAFYDKIVEKYDTTPTMR
jgi:lysophospholipase L1-like esterase